MIRFYVHDFYFEPFELENRAGENDFYFSVNVYYNFSPDDPGGGWDNLEYFNIQVASPYGFAKYLKKCIKAGIFADRFFYPHILVTENENRELIKKAIIDELVSISGKTERELMLKALRKFGWESESIPEVYNRLFD